MAHGDENSTDTIEGLLGGLETTKRFSHEQLLTFTSNLSVKLGSGGFGDVYKGTLHNGVQVAVKVLKEVLLSDDGVKDQFKGEVLSLGNINHKHVVKLYGFCFEQSMKALVYEFMENGSLDTHLSGSQSIPWETLCNIVVGTAKGLAYLHEGCQPNILHYDVKPANILLDSKFSPKVGDFGLAKLLFQGTTHINESGFRGTYKYGAPELINQYGPATHKCDVYSFGISLFDIIVRKLIIVPGGEKWFLVQVVRKLMKEKHEDIMEECGIQEKDRKQAKRILLIALRCTQCWPKDRPSMSYVVRLLEGTEEVKLPLYHYLMDMGSSSAVTKSVRQEVEEDKDAKDGKVVGIHGREGEGLDAIGMPMEYNKDHPEKVKENGAVSIARLKLTTVGPWGGDGWTNWDDGVYPGIKEINISKGIRGGIQSIQIWYCEKDGDPICRERHGNITNTEYTIKLDYPSEYLVRVTGSYGFDGLRHNQVKSLCFLSNKREFGPFGEEKGSYFSTEKDGKDGKVVGFHGNSGTYLHAIGMHMDYS